MERFAAAAKILAVFSISALISAGSWSVATAENAAVVPQSISAPNDPWLSGETLVLDKEEPYRLGTYKDGNDVAIYTVHRDMWASLNTGDTSWYIACNRDQMTDYLVCMVANWAARFSMGFDNDGKPQAIVLKDSEVTGAGAQIRVDKGTFAEANEKGWVRDPRIFSELENGQMVSTRFFTAPDQPGEIKTVKYTGFKFALSLMRHIRAKYDTMKFEP